MINIYTGFSVFDAKNQEDKKQALFYTELLSLRKI